MWPITYVSADSTKSTSNFREKLNYLTIIQFLSNDKGQKSFFFNGSAIKLGLEFNGSRNFAVRKNKFKKIWGFFSLMART